MASFKPYISAQKKVPEFTFRAVLLGVLLGLMFGVGNAYLGLKMGTTVSASIPAAVLSMTILRIFSKNASILENNLVQTIASVGEGLAGGVIFTVPALFFLGERPPISRIFLLSVLGGILGILFMIPMRRYIIVQEHGKLPFPEGTACAEILKSGEKNRSKALMAFSGIFVGALFKIGSGALYLWNEVVTWTIKPLQKTEVSIDCTPALLGVGYIIGPRISALLFAGGALGWWVLIPLIKMFGGSGNGIVYPAEIPIARMTAEDIWSHYIRYIGVGTVAVGGLLSVFKIAPLISKTLRIGFSELFQQPVHDRLIARTDRDISMRWLILGSICILLVLWLFPGLPMNFLTIFLLTLLGFFFVAVTAITVGIVGSTSNPVSGMTITTLLITCVVFLGLGWTERIYLTSAITMGIVACVTISLAQTTSQDLKTGFLLGATPRTQQLGEMIGVLLPAALIGGTVYILDKVYTLGSAAMPAPQGTMLAMVAKGVMSGDIPFTLVFIGIILGFLMELLRIPILPFAIGLYLPLSLSTPVVIGGFVPYLVKRFAGEEAYERGVLASSGLIAGDACMGVVLAGLSVLGFVNSSGTGYFPNIISLLLFIALACGLGWFSAKKYPTKRTY